jgi:hypothetical protein
MKRITIISTAVLLLAAPASQAQFLNKLKKKAQAAVTNAVVGGGDSANSNTAEGNTNADGNTGDNMGNAAALPASAMVSKYGKQLFSLQKSEWLVYGELSLSIKTDGAHVKTVTKKGGQFYLYENGARSGPFSKAPVDKLDDYKRDYSQQYNKEEYISSNGQSYISAGVLEVDGKKFGSALAVGSIHHNPKTKKFYAIVVRNEQNKMNYYLVSNSGSRKLPTIGQAVLVSDNGELGGVAIPATQYNSKSEADQFNFVTNDDTYIVLSNGKTIGPFKYVDGNAYLDNNGNYVQIGNSSKKGLFINGKSILNFNEDVSGYGAVFLSSQSTSGAIFENGNLLFSDGTYIKNNALQPAVSTENGVSVLNWIAIENNNVYLCKKEL